MIKNSTEIMNDYAIELKSIMNTVPIVKWPAHGKVLSKSGIETLMKARGFTSFERKRLNSSACAPIFQEMKKKYEEYILSLGIDISTKAANKPTTAKSSESKLLEKDNKKLKRKIKQLEKQLNQTEQRVALLNDELEGFSLKADAIEEYNSTSLRTLHV
jgi:septal ring factor EnvC (AmiA/AmiB activator)